MDKRTKKALLASIDHWLLNLDMIVLNHESGFILAYDVEIHNNTCPLCSLFYEAYKREVRLQKVESTYKAVERRIKDYRRACWGCPIHEKTLRNRCKGTPWASIEALLGHTLKYPHQAEQDGYMKVYDAVVSELELLYSLLED